MTKKDAIAMLSLAVLTGLLALPEPSEAKPRRIVSNGCTMDQIQSNFGNSCVDQMEQDILGNKPYTHALLCNGGEMLCCTYDNATNQVQTCRRPAGSRLMQGLQSGALATTGNLTIQRRGVEATAPAGEEEAPVPAWMTQKRMKQLQQDSERGGQ